MRVLKGQASEPRRVVTDGLRSYVPAIRNVLPGTTHDTSKTRTIVLRIPRNKHDAGSDKCSGLNQ